MNDDIFEDGDPNEVMDFDAASSYLANGLLVFLGTTRVNLPGGVQSVDMRFELEVYDNATQTTRALTVPASLGLPPSIGGLVELTSISDEVEVRFRLLARNTGGTTYVSFLDYFDAQSTPGGSSSI